MKESSTVDSPIQAWFALQPNCNPGANAQTASIAIRCEVIEGLEPAVGIEPTTC